MAARSAAVAAVASALACCVSVAPALSQAFTPVGPGTMIRTERFSTGPLQFSVLRVDLANPRVTLKAEPGDDSLFRGERIPDVVAREAASTTSRVLAAVNADFWTMSPRPYSPLGLLIANNMICNSPNAKRSVFALTKDRKVHIGPVHMDITIQTAGGKFTVDRVNDTRGSTDSVLLFTPPFGIQVPPLAGHRYIIKLPHSEFLPNQSIAASIAPVSADTSSTLTPETLILSVPSKLDGGPKKIGKCTIRSSIPQIQGVVGTCVGGGPSLLKHGQVQVDYDSEEMGRSFATDRHPRTAAGISADKHTLYLVTVDGRQPKLSIGQNLYELAEYMKQLGCSQAINLDGGGSTTMVVDGKVVNHPSDLKGPRPVTNSLVVLADPGSGIVRKLMFEPAGNPLLVPTGVPLRLKVKGFDETDTPVAIDPAGQLQAIVANISEHTKAAGDTIELQIGKTAGTGTVRAELGAAAGELTIRAQDLSGLRIEPAAVLLDSGEKQQLDVQLSSRDAGMVLQPEMINVVAAGGSIACDRIKIEGKRAGAGELQVSIGQTVRSLPYFVDQSSHTVLASFDSMDRHLSLTGTNYDAGATGIQQVVADHKEGTGAVAVQYAMRGNGRSRINVPVGGLLERAPVKLGVWILGDGKQEWLRANLVDSRGTTFTADFTEGGKGIYWSGEWRRATCLVKDLVPERSSESDQPLYPLVVKDVYIAQDQEALKATGRIVLDALSAEYPPALQRVSSPIQ
ncbi:MAG: phosphodiester glycosidase family protein [Candidatus Sumerlaeaceae bacterium]